MRQRFEKNQFYKNKEKHDRVAFVEMHNDMHPLAPIKTGINGYSGNEPGAGTQRRAEREAKSADWRAKFYENLDAHA
jgi:endonuclease I